MQSLYAFFAVRNRTRQFTACKRTFKQTSLPSVNYSRKSSLSIVLSRKNLRCLIESINLEALHVQVGSEMYYN